VIGTTPKVEREDILADFKAGRIRALTNANVLTTGFDYPDLDLIAMLRPTMSPGLYVQMAGRGMRIKSHTDHCLVLDFAGVVGTHGPIVAVRVPHKPGDSDGEVPVKVCKHCGEICAINALVCPACGEPFPVKPPPPLKLHHDDIMGLNDADTMTLTGWQWREHTSRASGKEMLAVSYYGCLSDPSVIEYFPVTHDGYAGDKARRTVAAMAYSSSDTTLQEWADRLNGARCPVSIKYKRDGKYHRVISRSFHYESPGQAGLSR